MPLCPQKALVMSATAAGMVTPYSRSLEGTTWLMISSRRAAVRVRSFISSPPRTSTWEPHRAALHASTTPPMALEPFSTRVASIPTSPRLSHSAAARWFTSLNDDGSWQLTMRLSMELRKRLTMGRAASESSDTTSRPQFRYEGVRQASCT